MFLKSVNKNINILIVCYANITRSPFFAEYLAKLFQEIPYFNKMNFVISSAGIRAVKGAGANQVIAVIANMNGFSLRNHRSRPLDQAIVNRSHLILTMEESQKEEIIKQFPQMKEKVFTILEFGRRPGELESIDVPDPTGMEVENYQAFMELALREAPRVRDAIEFRFMR